MDYPTECTYNYYRNRADVIQLSATLCDRPMGQTCELQTPGGVLLYSKEGMRLF